MSESIESNFLQPCLMRFVTSGNTFFLWGEFMMASTGSFFFNYCMLVMEMKLFRSFVLFLLFLFLQIYGYDCRNELQGMVSELCDGGYTDDRTHAAIAGVVFHSVLYLVTSSYKQSLDLNATFFLIILHLLVSPLPHRCTELPS